MTALLRRCARGLALAAGLAALAGCTGESYFRAPVYGGCGCDSWFLWDSQVRSFPQGYEYPSLIPPARQRDYADWAEFLNGGARPRERRRRGW